MNIYYANGGGLGHLTRARAFLRQLEIESETAILTSSKFAADKRVAGNLKIIEIDDFFAQDKENYGDFLRRIFTENSIEKFYLDSFPAGIIGEFADFDFGQTELFYIARLLRWKNYSPFLNEKLPRFTKTFVLETLETEHREFIENCSDEIINFQIIYPDFEFGDKPLAEKIIAEKSPFWLIVHAGEEGETLELLACAEEMREIEKAKVNLILISQDKLNEDSFDVYPASMLFPFAERIFTAGGFNALKQTEKFREKHFFLPFERRFDDQFARAKTAKQKKLTGMIG